MLRKIVAALGLMLVGGCAEMTSVYHRNSMGAAPSIITVDAKQRHVFMTESTIGGEKGLRICAEAAPDVFSALSASGGLSLDAKAQAGRGSLSVTETAASIERTQTVNLLRESLYRTCERYLSNGNSKQTLIVQAARDQRSIVATLAIEQLTRMPRAASTVIVAPSTSAGVSENAKLAELALSLDKERKDSAGKTAAARSALDSGIADSGVNCIKDTTAPTDDTLENWNKCETFRLDYERLSADSDAAAERFEKALSLAGAAGSGISTTTSSGTSLAGGGGTAPTVGDTTMIAIAAAVRDIANSPAINEPLMFCIAYLSEMKIDEKSRFDPFIRDRCLDIIGNRAAVDLKLLNYKPDPAGTKLQAYIGAKLSAEKSKHRLELLQQASEKLELSTEPVDVIGRIQAGDPTNAAVLSWVRSLETDEAALAELN